MNKQRERERAREMEKRVRYSVWLERVMVWLVNLAIGQIPRSSMKDNPQKQNTISKMTIVIT
jgi:hypothetical protein